MKKKLMLAIPEPCHEKWEHMTQAEKGRYCSACQKTVVDFSNMSDRELVQFFQKQQTGVCGRFQEHQLDRAIYKPKAPWPFVKYFFQATLPAFLLSLKAASQDRQIGKVAVCQQTVAVDTAVVEPKPDTTLPILATGNVIGEDSVEIPFTTLTVQNTITSTVCDEKGKFEITDAAFFKKPILVSMVGYTSKTIMLEPAKDTTIVLERSPEALMGEVFVSGLIAPRWIEVDSVEDVPVLPPPSKPETAFTLFPNPMPAGAMVTIRWKGIAPGNYRLQLQSRTGQHVWSGQTSVPLKSSTYTFQVPQLPAGTYVLTAVHSKTGAGHSEKIVVR